MILVAGANGRLGSRLVADLAGRGEQVRAFVRNPSRYAPPAGGHVEIASGDVRDPSSVDRAIAGTDTVVSAVHGLLGRSARSVADTDIQGNRNLIEAALRHQVRRFVLISMHGASASNPLEVPRAKFAAENVLEATNLDWLILRPTVCLETWLEVLGAARNSHPQVLGRGENPINFVSVRDVSATIVQFIIADAHGQQRLDIGGEDASLGELANRLIAAGVCTAPIRRTPRTALRMVGWATRPLRPDVARLARSAVGMDTLAMAADRGDARTQLPDVPFTTIGEVIRGLPRTTARTPGATD